MRCHHLKAWLGLVDIHLESEPTWCWLLEGALSCLSYGCLSILTTWQLASSRMSNGENKRARRSHSVFGVLASEIIRHHFHSNPIGRLWNEKSTSQPYSLWEGTTQGMNTRRQGSLGTLLDLGYNSDKHRDIWVMWFYICPKILWHFSHQKVKLNSPSRWM